MTNQIKSFALAVLGIAVAFMAGCFPESVIEWSTDGSIGLFSNGGDLYLIDGNSGELTKLETDNTAPLPFLSKDGGTLVYSTQEPIKSLDDGLKIIPPGQVAVIRKDAEDLKARIGDPRLFDGNFGAFFSEEIEEPYKSWVVRYLCEKDDQFAREMKKEYLQAALETELDIFLLKIASRNDINNSRTIMASAMWIWRPILSPDGKYVAYLVIKSAKEPVFELAVGEVKGDIKAMQIASNVSLGYQWRSDSKTLIYCEAEKDQEIVGTIQQRLIVDGNDNLAIERPDEFRGDMPFEGTCRNEAIFLAGLLFNNMMKVEYGLDGRVFFSSTSVNIPTTDLDEPRFSLFCFDPLTRTVSKVLPTSLSDSAGDSLNLFSISPDGKKVLLPMGKHRFAIYSFGETTANIPISEEDAFGNDMPMVPPSWKGNNEITALISTKSSFINKSGTEQADGDKKQLAVFSTDGKFLKVLNSNWPQDGE